MTIDSRHSCSEDCPCRPALANLDEQNIMQQNYLRQIRDAATIEYARGLAQEAIERSR